MVNVADSYSRPMQVTWQKKMMRFFCFEGTTNAGRGGGWEQIDTQIKGRARGESPTHLSLSQEYSNTFNDIYESLNITR